MCVCVCEAVTVGPPVKLVAPVMLVAPVKLVAPVTVIVRGPPMDVSEVPEKYVEDTFERAPSLAPALKKCSSDTSDRERSLLPRPVVGGGVMKMFLPSEDPLEIVTGEPPNSAPAPGPPRARLTADLNSSSRSAIEPVRRSELPRRGVMTRASPG